MGAFAMTENLIYNAIFSDGHFEREKLGALINKGGAAGKIFTCSTHPQFVAKIFHDRTKSKTNRLKLEAMIKNKPNIEPIISNGKTNKTNKINNSLPYILTFCFIIPPQKN